MTVNSIKSEVFTKMQNSAVSANNQQASLSVKQKEEQGDSFVKKHKKELIVAGSISVAAIVGAVIFFISKKKPAPVDCEKIVENVQKIAPENKAGDIGAEKIQQQLIEYSNRKVCLQQEAISLTGGKRGMVAQAAEADRCIKEGNVRRARPYIESYMIKWKPLSECLDEIDKIENEAKDLIEKHKDLINSNEKLKDSAEYVMRPFPEFEKKYLEILRKKKYEIPNP